MCCVPSRRGFGLPVASGRIFHTSEVPRRPIARRKAKTKLFHAQNYRSGRRGCVNCKQLAVSNVDIRDRIYVVAFAISAKLSSATSLFVFAEISLFAFRAQLANAKQTQIRRISVDFVDSLDSSNVYNKHQGLRIGFCVDIPMERSGDKKQWRTLKKFYRAANGIFGKIGRVASEKVILHLISSKCLLSSSMV